ncbi:hypothetical protein ACFYO0_13730 [Streptomyces sp. NPDC006365]|uniref:hypothetical protein n=1 Tax=Streptomyces sp. NPDC006365 TaxID=3364744 RepID=UPI00367D31E1
MTDPYRLTTGPGTHTDTYSETAGEPLPVVTGAGVARTVLWALLVISAIGNMVASYAALGTPAHLACGSITALCLTALVVQRLRSRR